jgi:AbrB family looped-hinge helix DNA binding protein
MPAQVDSLLPDNPIMAVAKVLQRGAVHLSPEVRERLGLKPGTKLILATADDAVVIRRAEVLLNRQTARSIVNRLRSMFSQTPIRDVEE